MHIFSTVNARKGFTSRPSSLQMACFAFLLSYHLQEHNTSVDILESSLGLDTGLRGNFDFVSVSSQPRLSLVLLLSWPRTWWSRGDFENPFFNALLQMQPVRYICFKNMLKKKKKCLWSPDNHKFCLFLHNTFKSIETLRRLHCNVLCL